jgi:hypothetical protein
MMRKGLLALAVWVVSLSALLATDGPGHPRSFFHRSPGRFEGPCPVYEPEQPSLCKRCCTKVCDWWHRICDRCDRCSCGYGKTNHDMGCIGSRGEKQFIFGSCWDFFEEPCNKQPQPPCPLVEKMREKLYGPRY